jgi:hypothetical protein
MLNYQSALYNSGLCQVGECVLWPGLPTALPAPRLQGVLHLTQGARLHQNHLQQGGQGREKGLGYKEFRARICKLLSSPGTDSKASIPLAFEDWRLKIPAQK